MLHGLGVAALISSVLAVTGVGKPSPIAGWKNPEQAPICFAQLETGPRIAPVMRVRRNCWAPPTQSSSENSSPDSTIWNYINLASWTLIGILSIRVIFVLIFSATHHWRSKKFLRPSEIVPAEQPFVSVIVPCYNEGPTLANCVRGLTHQTYAHLEIILVDDGSKDETWKLAQRLADEHEEVRALHKENGGKASALRYGIDHAEGSIIVCIDADSIFVPNTVSQLVRAFDDPKVHAVGGNVRVANRRGALTACQALDYIIGLNSNGRAYSQLGCMQVIPGAIGAFRKDAYYKVGGHSDDTLVEDMDLTIAFAQHGFRVIYNPHALAYTEAPVKMKDFINQRYRWTYGGMQVLRKYRRSFMFKRHPMSWIGLPMHMFSPWLNIAVSALLINSVVAAIALGHPAGLIIFLGAMYVLQFSLLIYMLTIDRESKRFLFMTGIETVFYIHLLNFVTLRAGINYLLKRQAKWHKIPRLGANQLKEDENATAQIRTATVEFESVG